MPKNHFEEQLDALERRSASFDKPTDGAEQEVSRILRLFGNALPGVWDTGINATIVGGEEAKTPNEILRALLETRGAAVYAFSHGARRTLRGTTARLCDQLDQLHRVELARLGLELLASFCLTKPKANSEEDGNQREEGPYRRLPLNILVVDNKPTEVCAYNELLPPELGLLFWKKARWWFVSSEEGFQALRDGPDDFIPKEFLYCDGEALWVDPQKKPPRLDEFDLILQDQFLGIGEVAEARSPGDFTGIELAEAYHERCPQALLFITTGLDVQSLLSLDHPIFADRIIPKHHLAALPWYYYVAFVETMGSMLWDAWLEATDDASPLTSRSTLRALVGTIRQWKQEPEILWHGQALAELVDHGDKHISELWRLADGILGARNNQQELMIGHDKVGAGERVLLALAIWLHDIGHRGDDMVIDPPSVRESHGAISERLLLQDPKAFGLKWLKVPDDNPKSRNDTASLTPLRMAALLCRYHQSSAPMFRDSIADLHYGLKVPPDHARIAWTASGEYVPDALEQWREDDRDLDWKAHDLRALEEFQPGAGGDVDIVKCACLLRLFDAIQLSRKRAGSHTRISTHLRYRLNRRDLVNRRKGELRRLLHRSIGGSRAYLNFLEELLRLEAYEELLGVQEVHLWRQYIVRRWEVRRNAADNRIEVRYVLSPAWNLEPFEELGRALDSDGAGEVDVWKGNFQEEVLGREVETQRDYLRKVFGEVDLTFVTEHEGHPEELCSLHGIWSAS